MSGKFHGKLGSGSRFAECKRKVERSYARKGQPVDSGAVCASIGRAAYGPQKFAQLAAKGRARARHNPKFSRDDRVTYVGGSVGAPWLEGEPSYGDAWAPAYGEEGRVIGRGRGIDEYLVDFPSVGRVSVLGLDLSTPRAVSRAMASGARHNPSGAAYAFVPDERSLFNYNTFPRPGSVGELLGEVAWGLYDVRFREGVYRVYGADLRQV